MLEEGHHVERQQELSCRLDSGQWMPWENINMSQLLWMVLTKGVDAALDHVLAVMEEVPLGNEIDWEKHAEWPKLMMWLGGRPALVLIQSVHSSIFLFKKEQCLFR